MATTSGLSADKILILDRIIEKSYEKADIIDNNSFRVFHAKNNKDKAIKIRISEVKEYFKKATGKELNPVAVGEGEERHVIYVKNIPDEFKRVYRIPYIRNGITFYAKVDWVPYPVRDGCLNMLVTTRLSTTPKEVHAFFSTFKELRLVNRIHSDGVPTCAYEVFMDFVPRELSGKNAIRASDGAVVFAINLTIYPGICPHCGDLGHPDDFCWTQNPDADPAHVAIARQRMAATVQPAPTASKKGEGKAKKTSTRYVEKKPGHTAPKPVKEDTEPAAANNNTAPADARGADASPEKPLKPRFETIYGSDSDSDKSEDLEAFIDRKEDERVEREKLRARDGDGSGGTENKANNNAANAPAAPTPAPAKTVPSTPVPARRRPLPELEPSPARPSFGLEKQDPKSAVAGKGSSPRTGSGQAKRGK